jgi:uncharacterized membrane-anchored protein YitT (DUF2179 family)
MFKKKVSSKQIIKEVENKTKVKRLFWLVGGIFLVALAFNLFILPLNLVSGVSGIAIVIKKTLGLDPAYVILLANVLLIIASLVFLGKKYTAQSVVGSILYPLFIELTAFIQSYVSLDNLEPIVIVVSGSILTGIGSGFVFKAGYNTGGTDIIKKIVSKYFKMPVGKSNIVVELCIVILGLIVFGWNVLIYSIVYIYICSYLIDKILIGISDHKTFQIITSSIDKEREVSDFLLNDLKRGVTYLEAHGGYTNNKKIIILCTVPTRQYFIVQEIINEIDPKAFYIVTDAYEVGGGE